MASPPKPWERAGASAAPGSPSSSTTSASTAPTLPQRPSTLAATVNQNAAAYSGAPGMPGMPGMPGAPGMGAYPGAAPYGSAYSSPYTSPYSRMGAYGGAYGGYGGGGMYGGGGYGGYGGGMYGGGGGMYGMQGNPNDPNSLTNRFSQSTATTFQMLEGVVGAFGGFAQMLESTYMATHSSFYAMISVAEQFGRLRETLGSILGIFTLLRWLRTMIAKLTGRPLPADASAITSSSFSRFEGRSSPSGAAGVGGVADRPRASRKPLIFFLLAAFGLPYLMNKLIRGLAASQQSSEQGRAVTQGQAVNPSTLEFCRVVYDFTPETTNQGQDLAVRKGDLVAVLSKQDPFGNPIDWWHCRTRDGRLGYLPSSYLETIKRNPAGAIASKPVAAIQAAPSDSSRANSLTSTVVSVPDKEPVPAGKMGNVVNAFQKSAFYN